MRMTALGAVPPLVFTAATVLLVAVLDQLSL